MDKINNEFIELVQSDYLSFVETFKEIYSVDDYSIIWKNKLEIYLNLKYLNSNQLMNCGPH